MTLWVDIYDIETGKTVRRSEEWTEFDSDEERERVHNYAWSEGNYSCDCNRSIFAGANEDEVGCRSSRFLAVDSNNPMFDFWEWNEDYPTEVKMKYKREVALVHG